MYQTIQTHFMEKYLKSTYFYDFETADIQEIVATIRATSSSERDQAIACYNTVRDGWRYNAYNIYLDQQKWRASDIAKRKEAHCIDKSVLLIACLRALGIPARIHLAKVKNHIAVEKLVEKLGTNELSPHGMVNIYLDGKWRKASPAFNAKLCELCNVAPLEFDGVTDSVFQEYNRAGQEFMEYLEDYGHFEDLPYDFILNNFREHYPELSKTFEQGGTIDFS